MPDQNQFPNSPMTDQNFPSEDQVQTPIDQSPLPPEEEKKEEIDVSSSWEEKEEEKPPVPSWPPPTEKPIFNTEPPQPFGSETTPIDSPSTPSEPEVSPAFTPPPIEPTEPPSFQEVKAPLETSTSFNLESQPRGGGLKKVLLIFLVLLILAFGGFALFKFVLPKMQKPKEVTLRYWGLWEPENVMQGIIADWQKDHPQVKIEYTQQSPKEYRERLQSALARNEGPDLFRFHITWLPALKNELEAIPAEVMSAAEFEKSFYPVAKENLRSGSNYLGIPLEVDTLALFYNQQIFQAAGKTPPTSWDQLRQLALDLTTRDESGRLQTAGVALGTTGNVDHWSDILGLMMLQNGVDLSRPSSNLAEDALTYFTIFKNTDRVWDETLPSSTAAFATGKVAMYFGYSWDVFEIKNLNPNLDFRIVPVPQLPGTDLAWASFWVEGVAKKSQQKKEAWEFLKFLSSSQIMQKLYQGQSQVRLFGEPYSRIDMANTITNNALVAPFVNQASKAKTWYLCSRTFDNGINDKMIKYFEDAVNAVNSGGQAKEILTTTEQGVSQLLSQYGLGSYTVK